MSLSGKNSLAQCLTLDNYYRLSFKILSVDPSVIRQLDFEFSAPNNRQMPSGKKKERKRSNLTFQVLQHDSENNMLSLSKREKYNFKQYGFSCDCMPEHNIGRRGVPHMELKASCRWSTLSQMLE